MTVGKIAPRIVAKFLWNGGIAAAAGVAGAVKSSIVAALRPTRSLSASPRLSHSSFS